MLEGYNHFLLQEVRVFLPQGKGSENRLYPSHQPLRQILYEGLLASCSTNIM